MITQPAIALGYCPAGSTDGTFSPYTNGCKALKGSADGNWQVTLDNPKLVFGRDYVVVTGLTAITSPTVALTSVLGISTNNIFELNCLDDADAAADGGHFFAVFPIARQT